MKGSEGVIEKFAILEWMYPFQDIHYPLSGCSSDRKCIRFEYWTMALLAVLLSEFMSYNYKQTSYGRKEPEELARYEAAVLIRLFNPRKLWRCWGNS